MLNNKIKHSVKLQFDKLFDGNSFVSIVVEVDQQFPASIINRLNESNFRYFHWSQQSLDYCFTAIDSVFNISINGNNRLTKSSLLIKDFNLVTNWSQFQLNNIPLFTGGIKFTQDQPDSIWNEYSDSDWFIPKFILLSYEKKNFIVFNFSSSDNEKVVDLNLSVLEKLFISSIDYDNHLLEFISGGSLESEVHERVLWTNKVNEALDKIDKGLAQKIVLSREIIYKLEPNYSMVSILNFLKSKFSRCYVFSYKKNGSVFLGASPERLAKLSGGWIEADALAGSIRRGKTTEEDNQLAQSLLTSQKNILEQKAVVDFIANSFNSFSDEVVFEPVPIIRKLENIQHLWTNIKAMLNSNYSIFELLKEIHPTPAICGAPWNNALQFIKELENHSRGLFSGVIGWFNFENEAEFAVAIRSALIRNDELHAYAGCGIVNGSDPLDEFEETKLKLSAILSILNHENIYQS